MSKIVILILITLSIKASAKEVFLDQHVSLNVSNKYNNVKFKVNQTETKMSVPLPLTETSTKEDYLTEPENYCKLQPTNEKKQKCPDGFTFYQHFLGNPFCYILTKPQSYPPHCPFQNYLEYDSIRAIFEKFSNQSMWVRARRNQDNGFGEFEWLEHSNRYKDVVKNYEPPPDRVQERRCMIKEADTPTSRGKFVPTLCDAKYPVLCIYSYSTSFIGKYCTKRNEFNKCISTNLNLDNQCYCQAYIQGMEAPRSAFCQKLAEPKDPFQNHLIISQLTNKVPCWFGLEKNEQEDFYWATSKESPNYTFWKEDADGSKKFGAVDYSKPEGWILEDDYSLKCAICETEVPYQNVKLQLIHIPKSNSIELRITNLFDIHNYFPYYYVVACFTDGNTNGLHAKIVSMLSDVLSIAKENFTKTISVRTTYPSHYWCETIQRPNHTRVLSNKILVSKNMEEHGREYALVVIVPLPPNTDPFVSNHHLQATRFINDTFCSRMDLVYAVRPMRINELRDEDMELLLHVSTKRTHLSSEEEHSVLMGILRSIPKSSLVSEIISFLRSETCLPEVTFSGDTILHWPETPIGVTTPPKELCIFRNGTPATRTCEGSFSGGASWGEVNGDCSGNDNITKKTQELHELLNSDQPSHKVGEQLSIITSDPRGIQVVDVHLVAEIMEKLSSCDDGNTTLMVYSVNNLMNFNEGVLKDAQHAVNSTDKVLYALDKIAAKTEIDDRHKDFIVVRASRVFFQISDLMASKITGFSIRKTFDHSSYEIFQSNPTYINTTLEDLLENDLEAAIFLSGDYVNDVLKCMEGEEEIKLIVGFFSKDVLFNEITDNNMTENSRIVAAFVPGFNCTTDHPLVMIFKPREKSDEHVCAHWNYGKDGKMDSLRGNWEIGTDADVRLNSTTYAVCQFTHTTHFALLMFNNNFKEEMSVETVLALNIITAVGCGLSLLGLVGIFVTAIFFKRWRKKTRNIIMLNFSVSLAAQMIVLFIADHSKHSALLCTVSGVILHYTILAEFAWMLIIAILQYRRFVHVFPKPIPHLILKCAIIGWCLPLIPVIILFTVFPDSYEENHWGLCYPQGNYFYYWVLLPLSAIVIFNLFVFVKILVNVCGKKVEAYGPKDNDINLQLLLAIMLFFLLGMSWIFGIASAIFTSVVFSYLFCLTATIQGFVIFIFFVIINKTSRVLWLNIRNVCFCAEIKKKILGK